MSAPPVTERRYPPTSPSTRRTPAPPAPSVAPWVLLTSTDQGAAPFDPAGYAGVGTAFDPVTGLFTIVEAGDVTQRQGYRSSLLRWTKRVTDLYPDFDPLTDILSLALTDVTIPKTGTAGYGMHLGIIDEPTATLASANGLAFGLRENTAVNYLVSRMSTTSSAATAQFPGAIDQVVTRWFVNPFSGAVLNYMGQIRQVGGDVSQEVVTATGGVAIDADPATWRLTIGDLHSTTTSGTPTVSFKVWHRRDRTVGRTGLPT